MLDAEPRDVDIDGLVFREVLSRDAAPRAASRRTSSRRGPRRSLNFRYAPDRTPESTPHGASAELVGRDVEIALQLARRARRAATRRSSSRLRAAGGFEVQPKQAWTNVADFAARGLDAVNLGPGATRYAHAVDERVEIGELERTYEALQRFLAGSV